MSPIRLPKLQDVTSQIARLRGSRRRSAVRLPQPLKYRNLVIDPLEDRQLLSLTHPVADILVNQNQGLSYDQYTIAGQSAAVDNDGDFVVTWTRTDPIQWTNSQGQTQTLYDTNVYARYFTDEVQRISLPKAVVTQNQIAANGTFSLRYGGDTVIQKLTISGGVAPYTSTGGAPAANNTVNRTFTLSFLGVQASFDYNESLGADANVLSLQAALRGMGGAAAEAMQAAEVRAISENEFLVTFHSVEQNVQNNTLQPMITWDDTQVINATDKGYLPTVTVERVQEPYLLKGIPVVPGNPGMTADNIEYAFSTYTGLEVSVIPVSTVTGVSDTDFDITFVNKSGKQDHPLMSVPAVYNEFQVPILQAAVVTTIKESSPEFRVNSVEVDDPNTLRADYLNQGQPAVAIDADGDFVITWTSEVSNLSNPGSISDVYARRFSPAGYQANPEFVQGVRPLGNEFRVNSTTIGEQGQPAVGMADDGSFVIAWASAGQDFSYFNSIFVQAYNRDGQRLGNEYRLGGTDVNNPNDTNIHRYPTVARSSDGHTAIAWITHTDGVDDESTTDLAHGRGNLVVVDPDGNVIYTSGVGSVPIRISASFDESNNLLLAWSEGGLADQDNDQGAYTSVGIRAEELQLYNAQGVLAPTVIRNTFRVNSASVPGETLWFMDQLGPQAMLDADGDMVITYDGYGPDQAAQDVDSVIDEALYTAQKNGATDEQLAKLRQQYEAVYASMRGEANGVMFTRIDTNQTDPTTILNTDTVVNNDADGRNSRYYLVFDATTSGGDLTIRVYNPNPAGGGDAYTDVNVAFAVADNLPDLATTQENIRSALAGLPYVRTGDDGPETVLVRQVGAGEIAQRQGTDWAINGANTTDYVFEITFVGSLHDVNVTMAIQENNLEGAAVDEVQRFTPSRTDVSGWFALSISGRRTEDIFFDKDNLDAVAAAIQTALEAWTDAAGATPLAGVTVEVVIDATGTYFAVTYGGDAAGTDQPQPVYVPRADTTLPQWAGSLAITTIVQGHAETFPKSLLNEFTYGFMGEVQDESSAGMEPDGDFTVVWTQHELNTRGQETNQNIYYTVYNETTDTAGPKLTDFLLPDGSRLTSGGQIQQALQYIVVSFDEQMMTSGKGDVTNPANWALLRDGVEVLNSIVSIQFGMNKAADLASSLGLSAIGSNKWEAVITVDGNGVSEGTTPLTNGHYELVAKNSLRDEAGNPLLHTGYKVNGQTYSVTFDVISSASGETRVNDTTAGDQVTAPTGAQTVASDADGDYVVVWTTANTGVYAKLYDVSWTNTNDNRTSTTTAGKTILVSSNTTAGSPSVACDTDGDFIVTWSQQDNNDWNVWARRYDAAGTPLANAFRVNAETKDVQRYSAAAMDNDGDFVITWQSQGQDKSGYGVYAQRYSPSGATVGGVDEVQVLNFVGQPTGSFTLQFNGKTTGSIAYNGSAFDVTSALVSEFAKLGVTITAEATSLSSITITFTGLDSSKDQPQITVNSFTLNSGSSGQIELSTRVDGASAEFLVNDTTVGNQRFPSIAMSWDGSFVISWTSSGQDGDAAYETNVYAKRFFSNDVITGGTTSNSAVTKNVAKSPKISISDIDPLVVTTDDPGNHVVPPGAGYDGVVQVTVNTATETWFGSGSLLTTGMHILTAAHVACLDGTNVAVLPSEITVTFDLSTGPKVFTVSQIFVNPNWTGDVAGGGDLAVLVLSNPAPSSVERYDIYRGSDELDRVFDVVGYGIAGSGTTGADLPYGTKRRGQNRFEATSAQLGYVDDFLVYDFDSGKAADDTLGLILGIHDLGLGTAEASACRGDSGGPNFIDGKIAGVTSWGTSAFSEFGTVGADMRVSLYADWIDQTLRSGAPEFAVNQTVANNQMWSSVGIDANGNFVITWTSYGQDHVGDGIGAGNNGENGIYARRFDAEGNALSDEFLVNTFGANNQQYSHVAMDADGDFAITWESYQDRSGGSDAPNSYGIYAQRYARTALLGEGNSFLGPNGEIGSEIHVNVTLESDQRYPGIAMDATGDFVIVWSGNGTQTGQADSQGVFQRRFDKVSDDTGPIVAGVYNIVTVNSQNVRVPVTDGDMFQDNISQFVVTFSEDLDVTNGIGGLHSIKNPSNWQLLRDGQVVSGGIASIQFGRNATTGKYEAIVTFDGDPTTAGNQPLKEGTYVLTIRDRVQDLFENALDGNYDGVAGGNFTRTFSVRVGSVPVPDGPGSPDPTDEDTPIPSDTTGDQDSVAVASNADGDYVVIWVTYGSITDGLTQGNVMGQLFDRYGQKRGTEFIVNSYNTGNQSMPDVAMDDYGNFVVVWAGEGTGSDKVVETNGIFARLFDANGVAQGDQFRVNNYRTGIQTAPSVAMDSRGNFLVTWCGEGATDMAGIWACSFTGLGAARTGDFAVNTYTEGAQANPDVAMDANGNYVIVWNSAGATQDGSSWGVYGRRYSSANAALSGEFRVNTFVTNPQIDPQVAMDADGDFVVAWSSLGQDGSGYGIYAQRYSKAGAAQGSEFRVNQTTLGFQTQPAISMADNGMFVVSWTTFGQDNYDKLGARDAIPTDLGIYARIFNADGTSFKYDLNKDGVLDTTGEFRVNATTAGDQVTSAITMDKDGDFTVGWVGPDDSGLGVYARVVVLNPSTYVETAKSAKSSAISNSDGSTVPAPTTLVLAGTAGNDLFEFVAGPTADTWVVKVNGVVKTVASNVIAIRFDGGTGTDRVRLTGTELAETATLKPTSVEFLGNGFTVTATNVETIYVDGAGGADTARLYDGAGDDVLTIKAGTATLAGTGVNEAAVNFETIHGFASTGNDTANLYDSAGDDVLELTPTFGRLSGTSYYYRAVSFDSVQAFASTGKDTAAMTGGTGNDVFQAKSGWARMSGTGYATRAVGFTTITAVGGGGTDTAQLSGEAATADTLQAWPQKAILTGVGYSRTVNGFSNISVDGGVGGQDVAYLYDSAGDDTLVAKPLSATLTGAGYSIATTQFETTHAVSSGKGTDTASLYDSAGDDTFEANATMARMYGNGFYLRAANFDSMNGFASTGHDIAKLTGTAGNESVISQLGQTRVYGTNFYQRAKAFDEVYADMGDGNDTATVYDAVVPPGYSVPTGLVTSTLPQISWFSKFEKIQLRKTTNSTFQTDINNVDKVFAYWT